MASGVAVAGSVEVTTGGVGSGMVAAGDVGEGGTGSVAAVADVGVIIFGATIAGAEDSLVAAGAGSLLGFGAGVVATGCAGFAGRFTR